MIIIESKRKKPKTTRREYSNAILADVTCGAKDELVKLFQNDTMRNIKRTVSAFVH